MMLNNQGDIVMRFISTLVIFVAIAWAALVLTDSRILISEDMANPGQAYYVEGYGNLGRYQKTTLVCKYFTGRKAVYRVFWYSPNNQYGRDSCKVLLIGQ